MSEGNKVILSKEFPKGKPNELGLMQVDIPNGKSAINITGDFKNSSLKQFGVTIENASGSKRGEIIDKDIYSNQGYLSFPFTAHLTFVIFYIVENQIEGSNGDIVITYEFI